MKQRRIRTLILVSTACASLLSGKLFFTAVYQHETYVTLAEQYHTVEKEVVPRRGSVSVQDFAAGKPTLVAASVERFTLSATPRNVVNKKAYSAALAPYTQRSASEIEQDFSRDSLYMNPLAYGLDVPTVERIAHDLNQLERNENAAWRDRTVNFDSSSGSVIYFIGGIFFVREYQRVYPEGALLGQVLGFVNSDGNGQYGIEAEYNQQLRGYAGRARFEKDSVGTLLTQTGATEGSDGASYELTIDRNIQHTIEQELAAELVRSEAKGGTIIVMDPKTGGVLGMASSPSYDPNAFRSVSKQELGVFDNPAISKVWEPGSIFKPLVMSAALDLDLVEPTTKAVFPAFVMVGKEKIETALRKAYGEETMTQVLVNSDNVAMVWLAEKIGNQRMHEYLTRYGFGRQTGVDLENEVAGGLPSFEVWRDIHRATISFGQGISVTPLQITAAYAAIANDGKYVSPHLVAAVTNAEGRKVVAPSETRSVITTATARDLRTMMVATVEDAHSRAGVPGYKIGGKTGTAQVPDLENGGYVDNAYNHSFVGMGPADSPAYVMLVKIDQPNLEKVGTFAEGTAVPLFGKLSRFLLHYYQIPPSNS
jgi:cell division protein FtsI/penicillin-binding protein 2